MTDSSEGPPLAAMTCFTYLVTQALHPNPPRTTAARHQGEPYDRKARGDAPWHPGLTAPRQMHSSALRALRVAARAASAELTRVEASGACRGVLVPWSGMLGALRASTLSLDKVREIGPRLPPQCETPPRPNQPRTDLLSAPSQVARLVA